MKISSTFLLNFISLNASSFIIKLLNFLLFIFLVRIFSIEDYGIYVLVWAQVNFFTPLLDFGTTSYGLVYLDEDKEKQLSDVLSFRFFLGIMLFIVIFFSSLFYLN